MRHIGHQTPELQSRTGADALRQAADSALPAVNTMGMAKGIYRFKTHEETNAHADETLARQIRAIAK